MLKRSMPPARPDLLVHSDYAAVATAVLAYLRDHAPNLYRVGGRLAYIKRDEQGLPGIRIADAHDIRMIVADRMQPFKVCGDRKRKDIALPIDIAHLMLASVNDIAAFRPLVGVTTAPLLREDGSIRVGEGYDAETALYCDHSGLLALDVPDRPSIDDARRSLRTIRAIFAESPFSDRIVDRENQEATNLDEPPGHDESTFLNGMLLAACRPSMPQAPAIIVRAADGNAGAGKTTLARAIASVAFGHLPKDAPFGGDMIEFDKTLLAELRTGPAAVLFDNGNGITLRSNLLNLMLTSGRAHGRVLGTSEMSELTTRALILMTGNALAVSADDIRRVLVVDLDARTEDPERRPVSHHDFLEAEIRPRRAEILQHLLTIWRWGRQHPELSTREALASFDTFCRWVRDPLLALGCRDPVARIDELKMSDPRREHQATVFREWFHAHAKAGTRLETIPITARRLDARVAEIIDINHANNGRAKVVSTLTAWRGVRVAGYVLHDNSASKGAWSPTQYWLTREHELGDDDDA